MGRTLIHSGGNSQWQVTGDEGAGAETIADQLPHLFVDELIVEIGVAEEGNLGLRRVADPVDKITRAVEGRDIKEGGPRLEQEDLARNRAADAAGLRLGDGSKLRAVYYGVDVTAVRRAKRRMGLGWQSRRRSAGIASSVAFGA
ncbi:hypothetical protein GGE67_006277 [Rhizobium leucaenae]|nr:hypothetical protein [Rhizobium leucaenae]MBB6305607.1 hypothetical protein [Rhizobium leucaenae]